MQDIVETKESFEITADAPGFAPGDIKVEMDDGCLTIAGKRADDGAYEPDLSPWALWRVGDHACR